MLYLVFVFIALTSVGCHRHSDDQISRFHEDGRVKPSVAIASFDSTCFDCSWSLAEEISEGVISRIGSSGEICARSQEESPFTDNPFGSDLSWMKREFPSEEFVAFLELVEHEFAPIKSKGVSLQEAPSNLNMAVRLRVIDLRPSAPKIVLQEMVRDSYFIPKVLIPSDYSLEVWGSEGFRKTPMGIAHAQLIQNIATRVSEYILLAKSR